MTARLIRVTIRELDINYCGQQRHNSRCTLITKGTKFVRKNIHFSRSQFHLDPYSRGDTIGAVSIRNCGVLLSGIVAEQ